jgi:hypothetical protein
MKKHISTTLLLALTSTFAWVSYPAVAGVDQNMAKCTDHPCPNTQTGEDPGLIEARKGGKIEDELRNDPNDKERWSNLILFSSSTDKKSLHIPIIAATNFDVSLDPKKGLLTFSTSNTSQSFKISEPTANLTPDNLCPKYQIRVIDGAPGYALIKKTCPKHEYKPDRFFRGTDYFIYDQKTSTMREIWSASTQIGISTPFPTAKPEVIIKRIKDGYKFDWTGPFPSDNPPTPMTIHNVYKQEVGKDGRPQLSCYDATTPSRPLKENEMCESFNLERVSDQ